LLISADHQQIYIVRAVSFPVLWMQPKELREVLGSVRSVLWGKVEFSMAEVYLQNCVAVHRVGADIITKKPLCDSE